ncbi:hypothetical protein N9Z83_03135 [Akkermansiaceae bacterium]|nr:hypothetical protein [Akkermansiaceae bacterium]
MKFLLFFAALLHSAHATLLYSTDFENFTVGDNQWAGTDGWVITDNANGISFIDNTGFGGALGNHAALGLKQPGSTNRVSVLKQITHNHTSNGESIITIDALVSIRDSSNGRYDRFYLSFFNADIKRMATIRFDNREIPFGIWREQANIDGSSLLQFDTLTDFIHEELDELFISIDLANNTWSASLSGLPLFENAPFTNAANPADINLGAVGFEWQISATGPAGHGDNFLLVADFAVNSFNPEDPIPPTLNLIYNGGSSATISWPAKAGASYQIEYSDDLETWFDDLPNSTFNNISSSGPLTFTDEAAPATRYYRVVLN